MSEFADDDEKMNMEEESALYESVWQVMLDHTPQPPQRTASLRPESKKRRYDIGDFRFLKVLGKGSFGKVRSLMRVFIC